mmetsp:Transcript_1747/g.6924  ORF Transcript_1747/g.6924 Transcript_1747/m.6924 type:complete len:241 (-) Transcript_1747:129-851(-)
MSSFSSSCSLLSLYRSSRYPIFTLSSSSSGTLPSSRRQRSLFSGLSSASLSSCALRRASSSCCCKDTALSSYLGMWCTTLRAASVLRLTSRISSLSMRISSSRRCSSSSPCLRTSSCMVLFSYKIHSSSLRSISVIPVWFRVSTPVSYCFLRWSMSFSAMFMMALSLSTSAICSSTLAWRSRNWSAQRLRFARRWSRSLSAAEWSSRALLSSLSFETASTRRISVSLLRIFSFSFISAMD